MSQPVRSDRRGDWKGDGEPLKFFLDQSFYISHFVSARDEFYLCLGLKSIREFDASGQGIC